MLVVVSNNLLVTLVTQKIVVDRPYILSSKATFANFFSYIKFSENPN